MPTPMTSPLVMRQPRPSVLLRGTSPEPSPDGTSPAQVPEAGGADRKVSRRPRWRGRLLAGLAVVGLIAAVVVALLPRERELRVDESRVMVAPVGSSSFQPSISVVGRVVPEESIRLDAVEGGRVEAVLVEDGEAVSAGQPLVRLSNVDIQLRVLGADAERAAQRDRLQSQRLAATSGALDLRRSLLDAEHAARLATDALARQLALREAGAISDQEFAIAQAAAEHAGGQLALARSALAAAESQSSQQSAQVGRELAALERTSGVTRGLLGHLDVRAPSHGTLSEFSVQIGTLVTPGTTLGYVDRMGDSHIRASLDEHYLASVHEGLRGAVVIDGQNYEAVLSRVFPDVSEGQFEVEFLFDGAVPLGLRKGQAVRLTLRLGPERKSLTLPQGPYLRAAREEGLFVVDAAGRATRRPVRLGDQSTGRVEVLSGLSAGDRVVVSSYEPFGDASVLRITAGL